MNWNFEINNINQLIGLVADVFTLVSIIGIGGYTIFNYKKIINIYKKIINISVAYNKFENYFLVYPPGARDEFITDEGFRSDLRHNIKIQ
jgi:hypothetical protein